MSDYNDPPASSSHPSEPEHRPPLTVIPVPPRPQPRGSGRSALVWLIGLALFISLGVNFFLFLVLSVSIGGSSGTSSLRERWARFGDKEAKDKIAIIRLEGVIMDGMMGYVTKQIEAAADDEKVKAIVLRVNSPGGSITASDEIFQLLLQLRDGKYPGVPKDKAFKKPIVVSMGALAASGGYYVSMPAEHLVAERTTITGSIGVYAAFPNISRFAKEHGIGMNVIKAGEVKASGSMFAEMKPEERELWQTMVDHAYGQFLEVVHSGRADLTPKKLREKVIDEEKTVVENGKTETFQYVRRRADGGIYTADEALKLGLIDEIGFLGNAVDEAAKRAKLDKFRAFYYEQPPTLMDVLLGAKASTQTPSMELLDPKALSNAAAPRLWYLMPGSDLAGVLAGIKSK